MREVMNAIFYMLRTGCQWDYLPKCFQQNLRYMTISLGGVTMECSMIWYVCFEKEIRIASGRNPKPSAGIIDSQTVKTAGLLWK